MKLLAGLTVVIVLVVAACVASAFDIEKRQKNIWYEQGRTAALRFIASETVDAQLKQKDAEDELEKSKMEVRYLREELNRMRRQLQERRKSQPEWDRKTFEEVGP